VTGGGGGVTGGGGGVTGGGGGTSNTVAQITAVRAAADVGPGAVSLPVQGALVTFVKPLAPDAGATDPAGFIVQAGATGPALFVSVDATTLPVIAGDLVDFTVTAVARTGLLRVATSITGFVKQSSGTPVSGLSQASSSVDFSAAGTIDDRECELVSITGTLAGDMAFAGAGYQSAGLLTTANLDAGAMKLRVPNALADSEGLGLGCTVQVTAVPLWRFNAQAQPSAFSSSALAGSTCPAPQLISASATSSTAVRATFDRPMNPISVSTTTMTIAGLSVMAVTGGPSTFNLTTAAQTSGTPYTLTASTSVADVRGTPISASARTANFNGYQIPASGIVINEVDYDQVSANPDGGANLSDSMEFVELFNPTASTVSLAGRSLVLINGTGGATYQTVDLSSAVSLAPGEYLVVASATTLATVPGTAKKVTLAGTINLIQNGGTSGTPASDAVAFVDTASSAVLDSISYEGPTTWTTPTTPVNVMEGGTSTLALADSDTVSGSVCRIPNGADTNLNATDFAFCSSSTPGVANIP
jgi:hypothetical protein